MADKLVVNLFGAPGSGKTTTATELFAKLKKQHVDTVLVSEFAKDKVVEENTMALKNQLFIWANQQFNIFCGYNHAQVVVTDSPILLGSIYNNHWALNEVIMHEHRRYNNLNIMLDIDYSFPYSMVGRIHTLQEAETIQTRIAGLLKDYKIPFLWYNETSDEEIIEIIKTSIS
jgi:Cdc6-like AAA superfamily ATPase